MGLLGKNVMPRQHTASRIYVCLWVAYLTVACLGTFYHSRYKYVLALFVETQSISPLAEKVKAFLLMAFVTAIPEPAATTAVPVKAEGKVQSEESEEDMGFTLWLISSNQLLGQLYLGHMEIKLYFSFKNKEMMGAREMAQLLRTQASPRDVMPTSRLQKHPHSQAQSHPHTDTCIDT